MKKQSPGFADFYWQAGYGCFGVSASHEAKADLTGRR